MGDLQNSLSLERSGICFETELNANDNEYRLQDQAF
jgi:hypothetical protein